MRHLLVGLTTLALLAVSGSALAQEEAEAPPPGGAFDVAGSLSLARTDHTATLLPDGRVLITGGEGLDPEDLSTAEVWDPATATFGPAEELAEPRPEPPAEAELDRTGHTATLLPDGRGLIIGGAVDGDPIAEAELHIPDSGELVPAGTLTEPRSGHSATFLRDGRVLVVGGTGPEGPLAGAEVWTSATKPAKCLGQRPTLFAQPGVEFVGSKGSDVIAGSVGADIIRGRGGNDRICGYGGDDVIDGGGGNDIIDGGAGADQVSGAAGDDRLSGGRGADTLAGGKGKDACAGGKGIDWLPGCNEAKKTRGTVTITRDTMLKGPHKGRFRIGKNGVTLDCDGHAILDPGRKVKSLVGVMLDGRKRVTIQNCDIRDSKHGVLLQRSDHNTIRNNRASRVGFSGYHLEGDSDHNRLIANTVHGVGFCCGYVLDFGSDRNRLRDNIAIGSGFGFAVWESRGNVFINNVATDNEAGFFVFDHTSDGTRSRTRSANNRLRGNSALDNDGVGFADVTTGGRGDAGTDNHYQDNTCSGNDPDSEPPDLCEQVDP